MPKQSEFLRFLFINRDVSDIKAYEESLANLPKAIAIHRVENEQSALTYLDLNSPPDAIFFDLNSLIKRPIYLVSEIKRRESLESIPLIVIGDGGEAENLFLCLGVGVNQFIKRPSSVIEFGFFIKRVEYLIKNHAVFPNFAI
jgi:response regulator RpfG family c-di-GMP phosphodiesterase